MPVYVYQVILEGDEEDEGQIFEVIQRMDEPTLTQHPITGQPVRRLIHMPNVATRYTTAQEKRALNPDNLARHGFTRYQKAGDGTYVKTNPGVGPENISGDSFDRRHGTHQ